MLLVKRGNISMEKLILSLLITSVFLQGCASSINRYAKESDEIYYARISRICKDKDISIKTSSGSELTGEFISINKDSVSFRISDTDDKKAVPISEINKMQYENLAHGMCLGMGSGTILGFGISYFLLEISKTKDIGALFLLIGGTFLGFVTGSVIGAFGGNQVTINLTK